LPRELFQLGVASGDPAPDGVVLWTRLGPDPVHGGGMPRLAVPVHWEVADDERFTQVRQQGRAMAEPRYAHSVHVEVAGLAPDRWYFYRFRVGGEVSAVGRTRTAPAPGQRVDRLRFAFASCQDYQAGYYTAYPHLVAEDLDFVAFLGDYIYEAPPNRKTVRQHEGTGEPHSLGEYRNRHARYRTDPALQAAHAVAPWIVTFDDHEVDNNWAGATPQDPDNQSPEQFRARRAAAFQAYYEHMPLRRRNVPHGPDIRVYRRLRFGQLATIHVLDTRQFRSHQVATTAEVWNPGSTMLGPTQEQWLRDGLVGSGTGWNLIANQTQLASVDHLAGPRQRFDSDNWDGYQVERRRLLEFLGQAKPANPVVLTGDRHATWVSDLRPDFDDPDTPAVGAEFVGTSITSTGDPDIAGFRRMWEPIMAESPHWKYIDNRRGYVRCDLTADGLTGALRVVDTVQRTTAPITTAARFHVVAGVPGVTLVDRDTPR
jgi:alkaline phosphatase D